MSELLPAQDQAMRPAYRIETARLVIRCWELSDAPQLKAAIDASLPELKRWLRWAGDEPRTLDERVQRLRVFRSDFDSDRIYHYGLFDIQDQSCCGLIALKILSEGVDEIGYWLRSDLTGTGLMSEACAALVRVAFEIEHVRVLEIRCLPENVRSAAIPRRLGFRHEATLRQRTRYPDGSIADYMLWSLLAADYPSSPSAKAEVHAFDALGRQII